MERKTVSFVVAAVALLALAALVVLFVRPGPLRRATEPAASPPPALTGPQVKSWKAAARKVEENRGAPIGRAARVEVPPELRHYADRRRFLAVQVAESQEQDLDLPDDYVELTRMIERGELVELPPVGNDYVLYGVGANVDDQPFAHYDRATGSDIPLYDGYADFQDADQEKDERIEEAREQAAARRRELQKVPRTRANARRRRTLSAQAAGADRAAELLIRRQERIASFYEDYDKRRMLVGEYWTIARLAADFGGRSYDLRRPVERQRMKARLLSFLRPEARDVLFEIARDYHRSFGRPLPVTSLVRTERYQQELGERNPNATRIEVPPHATGLAFDVYYHYMAADEQAQLMKLIAGLESGGKVEALRETRDHFHIFAFAEGRPPDEHRIASARAVVAAGSRSGPPPRVGSTRTRTSTGKTALKSSRAGGKRPAVRASSGRTSGKKATARPSPRRTSRPTPARTRTAPRGRPSSSGSSRTQ
jgi:uncharacterized protein DUF5715